MNENFLIHKFVVIFNPNLEPSKSGIITNSNRDQTLFEVLITKDYFNSEAREFVEIYTIEELMNCVMFTNQITMNCFVVDRTE